ncbi:MAG: hypothetical protein PHR81_04755 [Bacteroidales bacterium]|jgi:hypothetical protein|nr:hypothetical protein [Bacteroidales bacterium]MDD4214101.1 hypothetical protein [Bacteroidales bacterium]
MINKSVIVFFLVCVSLILNAQNVLILEGKATGKSYKYYTGDKISLLTGETDKKISGKITDVLDSSFVVSDNYVINIKDITIIYRTRFGFEIASLILLGFGTMYFVLDVVNNSINNEQPVFKEEVGIVAAALIASGGILQAFAYRKCLIENGKWKVRIVEQVKFRQM